MNDDILSQLNESQREAAACTEGPVMIIAGAGSGKTRTLTYRIAHLINLGTDPFNILALTFTNKAAAEMKERIMKLVGSEARNIWMGTFHSVFARILRSEAEKLGYIRTFTIYDNDDSKSAIKQIVKNLNLDPKTYSPGYVMGRISMAKSNLLSPEDYANNPEIQQADKDAHKPMIAEIYKLYNHRLRNAMAMDFDDLLFNMNILLRDFPDVLLKYQKRFQYIMVDEYQDTNYSQYLIVKKLAARLQNICVVGDDAQSIYAFRGANIQNIFNFRRDYPNLHLFKLEQNYRSTKVIVNAANSVIAKNVEQIDKEIWTDNAQGNRITLLRAVDEKDEGRLIANSISEAHIEALRRENIPYRIYQGLSFYGRKEIKDVLAYLRLVVNNYDEESLLRVINYPARGIGQTSLDRVRVAAADNDIAVWTVLENLPSFGLGITSGTTQKIGEFVMMIKRFSSMLATMNAYDLAKQIIYNSGIITLLRNDDDPDNPNRIENIEELLNGVKEFCEKEAQFAENGTDEELQPESAGGIRTLWYTHPRPVPAAGAAPHLRGQGRGQGCRQGQPHDHPRRQGAGVPLCLRCRPGGESISLFHVHLLAPGVGGGTPPLLCRRHPCRTAADALLRHDTLSVRQFVVSGDEPLCRGNRPQVHRDAPAQVAIPQARRATQSLPGRERGEVVARSRAGFSAQGSPRAPEAAPVAAQVVVAPRPDGTQLRC